MSTYPGSKPFRRNVALLLLIAGIAMVASALQGELLGYDDVNLLLGDGGAPNRSPFSFFTSLFYYAYLPFYGLSYWVDAQVFGEAPAGYHFANALWHVASSFAVFCLLGRLLGRAGPAALGAVLFLLHPVHVESVAWIAGRKELLSGFFFFLAWLFHLKEKRGATLLGLACFFVASFSKASAVVLPFLLAAAAWLLPRYEGRRKLELKRTIPYFAVGFLVVAPVHIGIAVDKGVIAETAAFGVRLLAGIDAFGDSIWRTVFPFGLSVDYPDAGHGSVVFAAALLASAVVALFALRKRAPVASFGIGAFLICLLPFNNVFPATTIVTADRYLYLSIFGAAVVAAWAATRWSKAGVILGCLSVVYFVLSFVSAVRFESTERLWTETIATHDASALAYISRGLDRTRRGISATPPDAELVESGIDDLQRGYDRARMDAHRAKAKAGLVLPLVQLSRFEEAVRAADEALALVPAGERADVRRFRADAFHHRAEGLLRVGETQHALADLRASCGEVARANVFLRRGEVATLLGLLQEAERSYLKASTLAPSDPVAHLLLAKVYGSLGRFDAYERMLEEASRRAKDDPEVVEAWAYFRLRGPRPDYRAARKEASRLRKGTRRRRVLEAEIGAQHALYLFRRGDIGAAVDAATTAHDAGLENPEALYDLGTVFLEGGRYDQAVRCFRAASDVLQSRQAYQDAISRALALKAYAYWANGLDEVAAQTMREALAVRPRLVEAGAAPLRGEVDELRKTERDGLLLLAVAAVAGDAARGEEEARRLLEEPLELSERVLTLRLRGLLRAFGSYDLEGARKDLEEALNLDRTDHWTRYRLAQILGRIGSAWLRTADQARSVERRKQGEELLRRAVEVLTELLEEDPSFHIARVERGSAYMALDSPTNEALLDAKADYSYVSARNAAVKEVYLKEAELHRLGFVRAGGGEKLDAAIRLLEKALRYDPNYFDAMVELGLVHSLLCRATDGSRGTRQNAFNLAIKWFRRAIAINPRHPVPRREYAALNLYVAREAAGGGQLAAASKLVDKALEQAPKDKSVLLERARLNMTPGFLKAIEAEKKAGDVFDETRRTLERVEDLFPGDAEIAPVRALYHRNYGWLFYFNWLRYVKKDPERAAAAKKAAVREWRAAIAAAFTDPENAGVRERLRELDPAQVEQDRAMAQEAFEKGAAAYRARRWIDAADQFHIAVALFPAMPQFRFNLALTLLHTGRPESAREHLEFLAGLEVTETEFPETFYELGLLDSAKKENEQARIWFGTYIRAMQRRPEEKWGPGVRERVEEARKRLKE
ncbi:MAG: tetratricopeptide repeat protein [Planctomycetota bacterium]|nr:tetratricopeptide repeat protein [Planctomycetota bacterium]